MRRNPSGWLRRTSGMTSKKNASAPLPPQLLYSLLKALGPERLIGGQIKSGVAGKRIDARGKRQFLAPIEAAQNARSAAAFQKLYTGSGATRTTTAVITELTVTHQSNGYTVVTCRYSDGTVYIDAFPTT